MNSNKVCAVVATSSFARTKMPHSLQIVSYTRRCCRVRATPWGEEIDCHCTPHFEADKLTAYIIVSGQYVVLIVSLVYFYLILLKPLSLGV